LKGLEEFITKDGSISLKSNLFNESFHSHLGALNETQNKFINPSNLKRFENKSLSVLDICLGLGYNSALLFANTIKNASHLDWYGLEIDKEPLKFALRNKSFIDLWDIKVIDILNSFLTKGKFEDRLFQCKIIWGDARDKIRKIPSNLYFDLIYLDGFSPQKCPEVWTLEFLKDVKRKLKPNGYLITYSSAAAVRKTLLEIDFKIFTIKPKNNFTKNWSSGTLAMPNLIKEEVEDNPYIEKLSKMEKEHLKTKASVPYRDPKGNYSSSKILKIRREEQFKSDLVETSLWRKKWEIAK
tara:strand:- start:114 stop:1004 length:891 start_codon:yes stop_codon:yes gene_type:complete